MRVLITGSRGFVGTHVLAALARDPDCEVIATAKDGQSAGAADDVPLDITEASAVAALVERTRPTHVLNLAGIASPFAAATDPDLAWRVHLAGTLNIARALLRHAPEAWLVQIGTGLVYGETAKTVALLGEDALLAPSDDYSASKAAVDLALGAMSRSARLKCVRVRPFNHTGAGQPKGFVVPDFALQIARIEANLQSVISVGNLDAKRDFLDVADVADAYIRILRSTDRLEPGAILNIASGVPRRIGDILESLRAQARVPIAIEPDPTRMRPSDVPVFVGDAGRARRLLGWAPTVAFDATLASVLADCRARVASGAARMP
ncbi:MAG: GDP-mannose 4,6-dehydratase [Proteobacteria bacterium]|nr:GDP-mannose 4,6-dehydratase [Pseudomonadota bacterium]